MNQSRPSEKTCTKCGESKPLEAFTRSRRGRFGRHSRCKSCEVERVGEYYQANREKITTYRDANRDRLRDYHAEWLRGRREMGAARYRAEGAYPIPEEVLAREVSYRGAHARVCCYYGPATAHTCEGAGCDRVAAEWALLTSKGEHVRWEHVPDPRGPSPSPRDVAYSLNPQDYRPLCRSCHVRLDRHAQPVSDPDTLTAEQVGIIAHTLGVEQGASDLPPCGVSWRERGMTGSPRTCTRPVGHDGPHGQRVDR